MKTSNRFHRLMRTTVRERARLLAAFDRSGLSAAAFARQHGLHYTTFCGWRQQRHRFGMNREGHESTTKLRWPQEAQEAQSFSFAAFAPFCGKTKFLPPKSAVVAGAVPAQSKKTTSWAMATRESDASWSAVASLPRGISDLVACHQHPPSYPTGRARHRFGMNREGHESTTKLRWPQRGTKHFFCALCAFLWLG